MIILMLMKTMTRYYASLTFPADALYISQLMGALSKNKHFEKVDSEETVCLIAHGDPYAGTGILQVLDEMNIPYDLLQRDPHSQRAWTEHVRFVDGERKVTVIDTEGGKQTLAREILDLIEHNKIDEARQVLTDIVRVDRASIASVASAWNPKGLYVLYSPTVAQVRDGDGYWSTEEVWTCIYDATVFTKRQRVIQEACNAKFQSVGGGAILWMDFSEAMHLARPAILRNPETPESDAPY
jgi:hypothetical protein